MRGSFYWKVIIECSAEAEDIISSLLFDNNCQGLYWDGDKLVGCFNCYEDALSFCKEINLRKDEIILSGLSDSISLSIKKEPFMQWDEAWKKTLMPVEAGKTLVIVAPWHEYDGDRIKIVIEPGMAFGTGHHATTRLCLEKIERIAGAGCRSLLDVGTGSGVLAIAARKLGIEDVVAIDIDPVAVDIAIENAVRNGVEDISISKEAIDAIDGGFDAVVANLTIETIKSIFADIIRACNKDGYIVLSGILADQKSDIEGFLLEVGITDYSITQTEGWLCVSLINLYN